ncbi:hypothetical protein HAX54_041544, partial [Datura stramonium]|nr:hypothetical protein [Datura stramonium]
MWLVKLQQVEPDTRVMVRDQEDSSSESNVNEHPEDVSMMEVKDANLTFNSLFALTARSDDEDNKE